MLEQDTKNCVILTVSFPAEPRSTVSRSPLPVLLDATLAAAPLAPPPVLVDPEPTPQALATPIRIAVAQATKRPHVTPPSPSLPAFSAAIDDLEHAKSLAEQTLASRENVAAFLTRLAAETSSPAFVRVPPTGVPDSCRSLLAYQVQDPFCHALSFRVYLAQDEKPPPEDVRTIVTSFKNLSNHLETPHHLYSERSGRLVDGTPKQKRLTAFFSPQARVRPPQPATTATATTPTTTTGVQRTLVTVGDFVDPNDTHDVDAETPE